MLWSSWAGRCGRRCSRVVCVESDDGAAACVGSDDDASVANEAGDDEMRFECGQVGWGGRGRWGTRALATADEVGF
ncbi:hypothetical protein PR202_ga20878 [Eleusine coracana subsp. coracana]|uniref:Uncharacterized protein n=1 Tax=Eleusine coracana subsp. coracana TaxID=191504 RepID=A0AAV5CXR2_ELECO|nr:hypothetical protein PR202_ga20878 [Eleusine coracana subsp. coracana]